MVALALMVLPLSAARDTKETDRLENCGTVMKEIMDIPDDIPQDLIDKAECVIIYPSVLKAAFVVGGSYGRGAMTCRTGEHFTGPWTARGNAAAGFQADLQPSSSNRPIADVGSRLRVF